jgi:hypothetical protein
MDDLGGFPHFKSSKNMESPPFFRKIHFLMENFKIHVRKPPNHQINICPVKETHEKTLRSFSFCTAEESNVFLYCSCAYVTLW